MVLIPVLLRPCPWKAVPWLKEIQMLPRDGRAVSKDFKDDWDTPFAEVADRIYAILTDPHPRPGRRRKNFRSKGTFQLEKTGFWWCRFGSNFWIL